MKCIELEHLLQIRLADSLFGEHMTLLLLCCLYVRYNDVQMAIK